MSTFNDLRADVRELFDSDLFTSATLSRVSGGGFDVVTSAVTGGPVTIPCRVIADSFHTKAADGALIRTTVFTLDVEPKENDQLTLEGKTYTLGKITEIAPDGIPILYQAVAV